MTAHNDDQPVGRILSRREVMAIVGAVGVSALTRSTGSVHAQVLPCVVRPQQAEGPFFRDNRLNRSDIRVEPSDGSVTPGIPLQLALQLLELGAAAACGPLAGALVDVWQCDASGVYAGFEDRRQNVDARSKSFLRGQQTVGADGIVRFTTIYPGWYPGRTVHIHLKVRTTAADGRSREFTSQLYFDDELTDRVHALAPYNARGRRTMTNAADGLYRNGGRDLMLNVSEAGDGGYAGTFALAMQMS